jgi:hypothetical protein
VTSFSRPMGRIWLLTVVAVAVAIGIVACGGDDDAGEPPGPEPQAEEPARDPEPGPEPEPEPEAADGLRGQEAVIYEYARTFCRAFPEREVARDLGLAPDADPVSIAEAYAGGKSPQFQEAAFEGCLEGLR